MPLLAIFSWAQFTTPTAIPTSDLRDDTHSNHPDTADYNPSAPTWIGETFTFNGGAPTTIEINDDDSEFEDAYVETGAAQTLDQSVTIDGVFFPAGSVVENEFSMLDEFGNEVFVVRINGENVGFAYLNGQEPSAGETFTGVEGRDGAPEDSSDGVSGSAEPYAEIICYAPGTLIHTPDGPRDVDTLRPGNLVTTRDNGPQVIRWIRWGTQPLEETSADAKPVQIKAGALGTDLPTRDLVVSPQHRILVGGGGQLEDIFDEEAFAPAKSLTALPGIRFMKGKKSIRWVHFACDRHEVVLANGCLSESLLLGPMVVNGLDQNERQTLIGVFGTASLENNALNGPPALKCLRVGEARKRLAAFRAERNHLKSKEIDKWDTNLAIERFDADLRGDREALGKYGGGLARPRVS